MANGISKPKPSQDKVPSRLFFVDNLRTFLIILVFLDHLVITYGSPFGLWYYQEGQVGFPEAAIYGAFQGFAQAFFMGLLFFLAGYFSAFSIDRKGPKKFLKDRLIRLGIPIMVFAIFIEPVVDYAVALSGGFKDSFLSYVSSYLPFGFGPLWFVFALLLFDAAYAVWRLFSSKPSKIYPFPTKKVVFAFGLLIGAITFAVRIFFPVGWAVPVLAFQFAFFPQYVAFFIFGLIAFRSNWIMSLSRETASYWGKVASWLMLVSLVVFVVSELLGASFLGGLTWETAAYAFYEQVFAIAVSIALVVWFRENQNTQSRFRRALSESSYTAYIIQTPVLVFLALSLQSIQLPLILKFAIISPIGISLCFAFAYLIRKIPKADSVL